MFTSTVIVLYLCTIISTTNCLVVKVYGNPEKCIEATDILKLKKISLSDGKSWLICKIEDYEP